MKMLFLILTLISNLILPEKSIINDMEHRGERNEIVDIVFMRMSRIEVFADTLIQHNIEERDYWLKKYTSEKVLKRIEDEYDTKLQVLKKLKYDETIASQMIKIYRVVFIASGCEDMEMNLIYLLNHNNEAIGVVSFDYLFGTICKTPEDFYNRNQAEVNKYYNFY